MKKFFLAALVFLILFNFSPVKAAPDNSEINSPPLTASQVINAINQYRQENGLSPLRTNSTLMALAQSHSEYQAATGLITHTGAGGSTPKDRAYAAGYGDGNTIFLSEIIYGGTSATVSSAMTWWKGSSIHNHVMLDSRYVEIGVSSSLEKSASIVRNASIEAGGVVAVARNPVTVAYAKQNGSPGAIRQAIEVGQALLSHKGESAIDAAVKQLGGNVAVTGTVTDFRLETKGGFDVGVVTLNSNVELTFWNEYMTPVFGVQDEILLGVYSHMIDAGLYLPDYPLGFIIAYQIEDYLKDKNLGREMKRMCTLGSITPNAWMQAAVGGPISTEPMLKAASKALEALGEKGKK